MIDVAVLKTSKFTIINLYFHFIFSPSLTGNVLSFHTGLSASMSVYAKITHIGSERTYHCCLYEVKQSVAYTCLLHSNAIIRIEC